MEPSQSPPDNRLVAENNELAVLKAVRDFGHLRRAEIGRAVWPSSRTQKMAQRTVARLTARKELVERRDAFGGSSLILSARGAGRLILQSIDAHNGYDL